MRAFTLFALAVGMAGAASAHEQHFDAGEPAAANAAGDVIAVSMTDADGKMAFTPESIQVTSGAVVKFVVMNAGSTRHEFVIGSRAENLAHQRMMAAMPDMLHNDPNAMTLDPGKSATLAWRFTNQGEFEFACLLPGHYEAGMHGMVIVK